MNPDNALPTIERAIRAACGNAFRIATAEAVGGGCISRALAVGDGHTRYFVKIDAADTRERLEAEADGLAAIRARASLRTPAVITVDADETHAVLVLEHLDLRPLAAGTDAERFGRALAELHRPAAERFGWPRDNFIGRTPQANAPQDSWPQFVINCRLLPQIALARSRGHGPQLPRELDQVLARVPALFLDYRPQPALIHGDLWHGNAAVLPDGAPVVYDPAVCFADREAELAMCELFGGFPSGFFAAYREAYPLAEGYEQRKQLYCLYHLLNHLNLFGRAYLGEVRRVTDRLMRAL